jgi:Arm DNA-binding domain
MYVAVAPSGLITFRYDYRLNGRRETLTIGRDGAHGISLSEARARCLVARKAVSEGQSPALEKQREKRRLALTQDFEAVGKRWFKNARMAESTRAMRRAIFDRDILPLWKNRLLTEITPDDLRALCLKVKDRGAPATAIHVRDIVKQIYGFAILHGEKLVNPADDVGPASIATFTPKDRALSPAEIRIVFRELEHVPTLPTIRLGLKLI